MNKKQKSNFNGRIYIMPSTICPRCGSTMVSEVRHIYLADEWSGEQPMYEIDFSEENQGNLFVCTGCGRESYIRKTTATHEDGQSHEYM